MSSWVGLPFAALSDAALFSGPAADEARELDYVVAEDFSESAGDQFPPLNWRVVIVKPAPSGQVGVAMLLAFREWRPLAWEPQALGPEEVMAADWPGLRIERALDVSYETAREAPNRLNWSDLGAVDQVARRVFAAFGLPFEDRLGTWASADVLDVPPASFSQARDLGVAQERPAAALDWAYEVLEALRDLRHSRAQGDGREFEIGWRLGALAMNRELRFRWPDVPQEMRKRAATRAGGRVGGATTGGVNAKAATAWRTAFLRWFQPVLDAENADRASPMNFDEVVELAEKRWPQDGFTPQLVRPKKSTIAAALRWGQRQTPPIFTRPSARRGRPIPPPQGG